MLGKLKQLFIGGKPKQERRKLARIGNIPKVGAHLYRDGLVLRVTDTMPGDLWDWFILVGWREVSMAKNRRKVTMLPLSSYASIARAKPSDRDATYKNILRAQQKTSS